MAEMPTTGAAKIWDHFIFAVKINMKLRQKCCRRCTLFYINTISIKLGKRDTFVIKLIT